MTDLLGWFVEELSQRNFVRNELTRTLTSVRAFLFSIPVRTIYLPMQ
jgi:hypothetical protein